MNIAKLTEDYVEQHPSIFICLKNGLLNYSSLARKFIQENDLDSRHFETVVVAARRIKAGISDEKNETIQEVMNRVKLSIGYGKKTIKLEIEGNKQDSSRIISYIHSKSLLGKINIVESRISEEHASIEIEAGNLARLSKILKI